MQDFHNSSETIGAFVVSVYLLGFCFGPLIIAPLSELYGRMPLYHISNVLFLIFIVACAVSTDLPMFIVFRFLLGVFGCTPLTVGGGTIADIMPAEKRGGAMAIWALGPLMGPVIGPVAGGYLSAAKGWRWIYWLLAMIVRFCLPICHVVHVLTQRPLERRPHPFLFHLHQGNVCPCHHCKENRSPPQRDWQRLTPLEIRYWPQSPRALSSGHCPPDRYALHLAHRIFHVPPDCTRLWIPLPPLHYFHLRL